jgi:CDP-2,3-bis-(O-geranylgeranyl)-sn-glycerol synthase
MELLTLIIEALWFILPAYVANSAPVDVSQISFLKKYGKPIDGGRMLWGNRVLGDGKTWRGLIAGLIAGTLIGYIQTLLQSTFQPTYPSLPQMTIPLALMLSAGALFGDMAASFLKRRLKMQPGDPAPILDQLDFIIGAFAFAWTYTAATTNQWTLQALENHLTQAQFWIVIIITPFTHMIGNAVAYLWKLKKKPW